MRNVVLALTLLLAASSQAQDGILWTTTLGTSSSDVAHDVARTDDGGSVVAGTTFSVTDRHSEFYLIRTDPQGVPMWERTYGGGGWDVAYGVTATSDGGFAITGYTTTSGAGGRDIVLIKTDSQGTLQWTRTFGGSGTDVGRSVVETADRGFAICGSTQSFSTGETKMLLVRTDDAGHELWSRIYGGTLDDDGRSVVETDNGDFLLGGATGSFGGGNRDIWLVKVDAEGEQIWSRTVGISSAFDWASCAVETSDGGAFAVGHGDLHGRELLNMQMVRTDGNGDTVWQSRLGEALYDYGTGCLETTDGDLLALGVSKSGETLKNSGSVVLVDGSGNELWNEVLVEDGSLWVESVEETEDGFLVVGSLTSTADGNHDAWLGKISNATPRFEPSVTVGAAPLEVHFEDRSTGIISGWSWDFDGDGVTDSTEQHPTWVYGQEGTYSVHLEVTHGPASRTIVREELIEVERNPRAPRQSSGRRGY